jgi:hypothetical protein
MEEKRRLALKCACENSWHNDANWNNSMNKIVKGKGEGSLKMRVRKCSQLLKTKTWGSSLIPLSGSFIYSNSQTCQLLSPLTTSSDLSQSNRSPYSHDSITSTSFCTQKTESLLTYKLSKVICFFKLSNCF